ncbi:iron chelate uptake ABC transporter family permease subunit [Microbacterium foliorum]|uniref:FecCD family ABC transporter permease n=1 Tax=Microbacterium foliorum TaxID=104336 RepID=UPI0028D7384A|nr:iron chelate uptake ABC transporter family permease subunit [Microbacterium foliorum]
MHGTRALAAVFFGAALALSGTVFQTITSNPLGSPDVIGLTTGAYTGALIVMTSGSGSGLAVAIGAILGGFGTAVLVALLIAGRGALGYSMLIVVLACAQRGLWLVELGDDIGTSLGGRMGGTKAGLVAIAVGLTGVVTAVIGPVAFIALAAPHLARLIVRNGPAHLVATALMGATLLSVADIIAQNAVPKHALPVGVVTLVLGGAYLIYLVVRTARRRV